MISALVSFLGGSVFRMIWGEASAYLNKRQDHRHETEMLKVQAELDQAKHGRDLEQMRLANELGVKMVEVQKDAAIAAGELDAFSKAIEAAARRQGSSGLMPGTVPSGPATRPWRSPCGW